MEIYSKEELDNQRAERKRAKIVMAAVSAAALVFCIVMFCVVSPVNEKLCRTLAIIAAVLAGCIDIYIIGFILPYIRPDSFYKPGTGKAARIFKNIARQLLLYIMWGIIAGLLVSFVFDRITDTVPAKKITIFADVPEVHSAELEAELGKDLPEGIKMVKAHTFSYSMFGMVGDNQSDIFIVKKSDVEEYIENFAPLSEFLAPRDIFQYYMHDGVPYGVLVKSSGPGIAASYIDYEEGEEYYMFFGKLSPHPGTDGAAAYIAERLLLLR